MNKAQQLLQLLGTNTGPEGLAAVAELTDEMPINKRGIENHIKLLQDMLSRSKLGRDSHVQGLANIGIIKLNM
jgi:hypothetical protein